VLLEALTQRAPVWTDKQSDPKIPASVADPFREIAANCLRRDPTQRWTIRQIGSALNPSAPIPEPQKPVMVGEKTPVPARSRRLAFPVVAGAVVILAAILAAKFAGHSQSPTDTATTQTTVAQPQTGQSESLQQTASAQPIAETKAGVSTSSGSSTGEVLKQVVPDVPRSARNTIHGTVKVAVLASVDTSGNVSSTKFERRGPSEYFANLAMKAAREWKFKSPQVNGREVASAWSLQFDFRRSGTTAHPTRKNP
jgi:TonB family protein